ncbi:penicillin-binding protein 1C [Polymorphobacter fuscus]|uniref:peptidoglycan glycosyltransferase n=1 Tax=Sandarakinorhabdus fusca TaxID=1439888 RepID=A0A7C9GVB9_9SPHN|nr:penicillin-binding protein 1C [Polymorphobacter fuscus]KAB7646209.1 penicillin-binding protein 1C [Polymorphobacter fuscus]MQT17418.1 penicillin-binding protein 1C [Polymorphobacter fuscus]NJC10047.1 penicillin-binding protein 1C [Polymorphobacter fuscus]
MTRTACLLLVLVAATLILLIATTPLAPPDFAGARSASATSEARLLARDGRVLAVRRTDPNQRRLAWVPLADISPALRNRIVAAEDRRFAEHAGIDWRAVAASVRDRAEGRANRGASTITMQLTALLDPTLGSAGTRSWRQKIMQGRAAVALERRWTKDQILEAWLNLLPFRGDLVGIDAAARGLAGHAPAAIDAAEAAVLTALARSPQAPPATVTARACRTAPDLACARIALTADRLLGPRAPIAAPDLAPQLANRLLVPGTRGDVATTIDADVQRLATAALTRQMAALSARGARDGAAIVVDNASGDILAWVGSAGPASTAASVDGVTAQRQAGSTLKPQLYALALERRLLTAASVLDDSPVDLDTASGLYVPQNYDRQFRGPVSVRSALGNSLNVPAVRTLLLVGVDGFRERLFDIGYAGITRDGDYYGFSLALGSAEVSLVEQAAAFRALARGGRWSLLRITPGAPAADRQAIDAGAAAIIRDILSDPAARTATFGEDNGLVLPFPAAVKTGTSKALRDNWCIGFSDRFTVGVWVGNFEGDPMVGVSGTSGAAPAWAAILQGLHAARPGGAFRLPPGIVRQRVSFVPAIEPPRDELFLAGTEMARFTATDPAAARPRLLAPADGSVVALDPDIPPARQRVTIRARTGPAALSLTIDGRPLATRHDGGTATALWAPVPGVHVIALTDGRHVFDRARLTVR